MFLLVAGLNGCGPFYIRRNLILNKIEGAKRYARYIYGFAIVQITIACSFAILTRGLIAAFFTDLDEVKDGITYLLTT